MSRKYWAVSAGDQGRDYASKFLEYGMAFVGGDDQRRRFKGIALGDVMVLKIGKSSIKAVGEVVDRGKGYIGDGNKEWLMDFDGWELPAYCYVDWHIMDNSELVEGLSMGTIYEIGDIRIITRAIEILNTVPSKPQESYKEEPDISVVKDVKIKGILPFLIQKGFSPINAEALTSALRRVELIARYYWDSCYWEDIREHETRAFLVIPLLLSLGWSEQLLKIELPVSLGKSDTGRNIYGKIDIACFSSPYHPCHKDNVLPNNDDCVLIIETKGYHIGLDFARNQADKYAMQFKNCRAIVTTNGYCYKVFLRDREKDSFNVEPFAYMNLLKRKDRYIQDTNVAGVKEVIEVLLP